MKTNPWKWAKKEKPTLHDHLWEVCKTLPSDFQPYGELSREGTAQGEKSWYPDCSCGCKFFKKLEGQEGCDWGVCWNPNSPRKGLLTFEHQGCPAFVYQEEEACNLEPFGPLEDLEEDRATQNPPTREEDPI